MDKQINKMWDGQATEYHLATKSNAVLVHTPTWMDPGSKGAVTKDHTLHDSTYMTWTERRLGRLVPGRGRAWETWETWE